MTSSGVNTATRGNGPRKASSSGVSPRPSMFFRASRRARPNQLSRSTLISGLGIEGFGFLAMAREYQSALIRANRRSRSVLARRREDVVAKTGTPEKGAPMAAAAEAWYPITDPADAEIRRIARLHQAQAFDNVDLDRVLEERPLTSERARWIGRHLMLASKGTQAYRDGQRILSLLER